MQRSNDHAVCQSSRRAPKVIAALLTGLTILSSWATATPEMEAINRLIDGLHRDADRGEFQSYFDSYTPTAVFMGTDKTARWTIDAMLSCTNLTYVCLFESDAGSTSMSIRKFLPGRTHKSN